jgi:hypothetical protein
MPRWTHLSGLTEERVLKRKRREKEYESFYIVVGLRAYAKKLLPHFVVRGVPLGTRSSLRKRREIVLPGPIIPIGGNGRMVVAYIFLALAP